MTANEARRDVDIAVRKCWLALRRLTDFYLNDADSIPDADLDVFTAVTKHPAVQDKLSPTKKEGT